MPSPTDGGQSNVSLPDWTISDNLAAWFFVANSRDLAEGGVLAARVGGQREVVLFRANGQVSALDPHCAHMGARLAAGKVEGDHLVCPLHGWRYQGDGAVAGGRQCVRSWPVVERLGAILVFNGREPLFDPPQPLDQFHWSAVKETEIGAPWYALTANAFDTHHYEAVHKRRLLEPPLVERVDPYRFACSYVSYATGDGPSDKLMNWLSGGRIKVRMECYGGPIFVVRSQLGERQSALLVGLESSGEGSSRLRLAVGSLKGGTVAVLTAYLYTTFLKRDLGAMTGIKLKPYTGLAVDAIMEQFARYLESLPEAE